MYNQFTATILSANRGGTASIPSPHPCNRGSGKARAQPLSCAANQRQHSAPALRAPSEINGHRVQSSTQFEVQNRLACGTSRGKAITTLVGTPPAKPQGQASAETKKSVSRQDVGCKVAAGRGDLRRSRCASQCAQKRKASHRSEDPFCRNVRPQELTPPQKRGGAESDFSPFRAAAGQLPADFLAVTRGPPTTRSPRLHELPHERLARVPTHVHSPRSQRRQRVFSQARSDAIVRPPSTLSTCCLGFGRHTSASTTARQRSKHKARRATLALGF